MSVYVVRHGKAGSRGKWRGPDELRPLSRPGRTQADGLASWLAGEKVDRILSSPYVRCRETVEPLAAKVELPVDLSDSLAEGASLTEALRLVEKVSDETVVLCTHGDVLGELLAHADRHGAAVDEGGMEKGATWVLDLVGGSIVRARYVPPPV